MDTNKVQSEGSRYYATFVDDTRRGTWAIASEDEEQWLSIGLSKTQALFGLMLLDNEGLGTTESLSDMKYELDKALDIVPCPVCEKHFMRAQMHEERCISCLS